MEVPKFVPQITVFKRLRIGNLQMPLPGQGCKHGEVGACAWWNRAMRPLIAVWVLLRSALLQVDKPLLRGNGDGLGAVARPQFPQYRTDMEFYRSFADIQLGCDLFVG